MKIFNFSIFICFALLLSSCTSEVSKLDGQRDNVFTLTASMPAGRPETRLALTETDEGNISVKWKEGDKISLCFVSGETVRTLSDIAVTNIREDGKKADFSFALPEGITAPFDLYGIYGAAFKSDNNSVVLLNANEDEEVTLDYVAPRSAMRFALKDITDAASLPGVTFEHLGSIMKEEITNGSATGITVNSISIIGDKYGYNWAYGSSGEGKNAEYDLATGTYTDTREQPSLMFSPVNGKTIATGGKESFYRWFIPTETPDNTKSFSLMLNHDGGTGMLNLPYKEFGKGKHYRLKLWWDGTNLKHISLPPTSDLVAHWPMDGNANDVSGNGHHGTIFGGVTPTEDHKGRANGAYLFNGTDGYIDVGDWENGGAMTIACWARWDAFNHWSRIIDFGNGEYQDNIVVCNQYSVPHFSFHLLKPSSTMYEVIKENSIPTTPAWAFYTASVDDAALMKIYRNDVLLNSKTGIVPAVIERTQQYIGKSNFIYNNYFKGAIGDLRIYNRALTDDEVRALYLLTK